MTTVMPRPFDLIKWSVGRVEDALKQAEGQPRVSREVAETFKNFQKEVYTGGNQMRDAMATEIRWMNDGRTFPWSVDTGRPQRVKYDEEERYTLDIATRLQRTYRKLAMALDIADNDRRISPEEHAQLSELVRTVKSGIEILIAGVDKLRESKNNNKPAYELFNTIKNQVNDISNDTEFGPFGTLVRFGEREAEYFLDVLNYTVTDWGKKQEVIETLYDTAASPYGNLVLDQKAADKFKEQWGHLDLDWSQAVDAYKDDHPIVALYAVAIDREIENGNTNVRELEAMLHAGEAAREELSVSFVRNGPVVLATAEMPEASAAFASASSAERADRVEALGQALTRLRARIAELKTQA